MFIYKYHILLLVSVLACVCSCSCSTSKKATITVSGTDELVAVDTFSTKAYSTFTLNKEYDLGGKTFILPQDVTIRVKNGIFKNGTLIGQNTKIEGNQPVFDKVTIKGEWDVPEISTKMFKDLSYDNSLRDVMALTNDNVNNTVIIQQGNYYIKLSKNLEDGICINANTRVVLNGIIRLKPNGFTNYCIVKINGPSSSIEGGGSIIGDRKNHTGTQGEWGMGVEFSGAQYSSISGLTVKDCWGDCIYVGDDSKNIVILNCVLDNSRRQGISITSADSVFVKRCIVSNILGTPPQYAIDVQPNADQTVTNVFVEEVQSIKSVGGFVVSGIGKNAKINNVVFSNCKIRGATTTHPIVLFKAEDVTIEGCDVDSKSKTSVLVEEISSIKAYNNIFRAKGNKHIVILKSNKTDIDMNQYIIK